MSAHDNPGDSRAGQVPRIKRRGDVSKRMVLSCLAALAFCSQAHAITFTNGQFDASAVALVADAPAGFDTQSGAALDSPVIASASAVGATDVATAGAIGAPGVMTSSADVSGAGGIASATATSHFTSSFVNTGTLNLLIDFTPFSFATGSGLASTSLFVLLTSNGVTLFQDYLTSGRTFSYAAVAGTTGLLDLTLTSDVSAGFASAGTGDASSAGQVSFSSPVPEAGTWLLFAIGLGGLSVAVRRGRR